ncbi:TPA: hypothetical protein QIS98_002122 [Escherichia coli]|uniref:hypothetical protein n=1 Tax=Citrobacter sp. R1 TaxID=2998561 RepID=UPI00164C595F|nr:hypothetical protein [Citrobacter sp. R1]MBC4399035.1 hypothetical protein [Klebsiella pneumoniae]HDX4249284.1 hypothetical protein [Klebsiella oxytoca]HDX4293082.1 hypothetical protein [Escherichia coli]HBQ2852542.1 hypothetical protein [Klebsiella pneumoniae]HEP0353965.1 hypothetical protein [Escherichia coli]
MNELQTALDTLANNGSWKDALLYGGVAFIGFTIVSALFRSAFFIILGAVAAFYIFSLQTPDSNVDLHAIAPEKIVSMMVERSACAADSVGEINNIGKVIRNGDVLDIAKKCGLMP